MLNVASTVVFTILALTVNVKMISMEKMNVIAKISCYCRYTKTAQRIFKCSDIQYASLTLDKILNSLIYKTLF